MIPFTEPGGTIYKQVLLNSPNPLYQYLGTIVVHPRQKGGGWGVYMKMCKEDVHGANTHVFLGNLRPHYEEYGYGKWHKSTDNLEGLNPYTVNIVGLTAVRLAFFMGYGSNKVVQWFV